MLAHFVRCALHLINVWTCNFMRISLMLISFSSLSLLHQFPFDRMRNLPSTCSKLVLPSDVGEKTRGVGVTTYLVQSKLTGVKILSQPKFWR